MTVELPIKWSLLSTSWIWTDFMTCLAQQNAEATVHQFKTVACFHCSCWHLVQAPWEKEMGKSVGGCGTICDHVEVNWAISETNHRYMSEHSSDQTNQPAEPQPQWPTCTIIRATDSCFKSLTLGNLVIQQLTDTCQALPEVFYIHDLLWSLLQARR